MPKPRYTQLSLEATRYYHCVSRCVRRAFLCGKDTLTGQSFNHRRQWIEDKMHALANVFSMDLCAYAIMSNHYHVVLHVDTVQATGWSRNEVIQRWHSLFRGQALSQRYVLGASLSHAEMRILDQLVATWRERLMNISWFMRILNEGIARKANREDDCSGRFWEGRFKSQALLDEKALLTCMAYVDLNPIRSGLADTPEQSEHTSIRRRTRQAQQSYQPNHPNQQDRRLLPFVGNPHKNTVKGIPFRLTDYIELVDWTGRYPGKNKQSVIHQPLPGILVRLNIQPDHWKYLTQHFESSFKGLVGTAFKLKQICNKMGYLRTPGIRPCLKYLPSS